MVQKVNFFLHRGVSSYSGIVHCVRNYFYLRINLMYVLYAGKSVQSSRAPLEKLLHTINLERDEV